MKVSNTRRARARGLALVSLLGLLGSSLATVAPADGDGRARRSVSARESVEVSSKPRGVPQRRGRVSFEANRGQHDGRVRFVGRGGGQTVFLAAGEAAFLLPARGGGSLDEGQFFALRMKLVGASEGSDFEGEEVLDGRLNYLKGDDPRRWAAGVPLYGRVRYGEVYPGVGMTWYGAEAGGLEYDFIVEPGADPGRIVLEFEGADRLTTDSSGDLLIETAAGTVRHRRPLVYQEADGVRRIVEGEYLAGGNRVGFRLGEYDRARPLVIDPVIPPSHIVFSTYLGGSGEELVGDIKVDAAGGVYVAGSTFSPDYPNGAGFQTGSVDCFVTKMDAYGSDVVFSTRFGGAGANSDDKCTGLDLDDGDNVYVTGQTNSTDFPTGLFGYDKTYNGGDYDAFAVKLTTSGTVIGYSTFLGGGGQDFGRSIAVDGDGSAYVAGVTDSPNYKVTAGAFDTTHNGVADAFVTKLNPTGTSLSYSTYLGGGATDEGKALAVDGLGRVFVTGKTLSGNFPTTLSAYDKTHSPNASDVFVAKLNSAGSALVYSTYLGGGGEDVASGVAVDGGGSAYVTGYTNSTDFPVTRGALQTAAAAYNNAFVTKVNSSGSGLQYSTYLGGSSQDSGSSIKVNGAGEAYVTGSTSSADFPVTFNAYDDTFNGGPDAFLLKLTPAALTDPSAATFLGGSMTDAGIALDIGINGDAYVAGRTHSTDYPTSFSPYDKTHNGGYDTFITRYSGYWLP
jgi:hypothetical protein